MQNVFFNSFYSELLQNLHYASGMIDDIHEAMNADTRLYYVVAWLYAVTQKIIMQI